MKLYEKLLRLPPKLVVHFDGEVEVELNTIRVTATDGRVYKIEYRGGVQTTAWNKDGSFSEFIIETGYDVFKNNLRFSGSFTTTTKEELRREHIVTHEVVKTKKVKRKYRLITERGSLWDTYRRLERL